ncbi:MAG: LysR family transcriptional regulator [Rhizobiaceae bacterium]|nr:LysR family transcriptional regulator [Rhizobiaceae bacterium]
MKFRLRQMEVFRAVMLTGSISGAAKMLFVSQPAVSRIVSHTESSLGLSLFTRKGGKLIPTIEAERLYAEVDDFYRAALQVDEFARNLAQGTPSALSIVGSPSLSRAVLVPAIQKFCELYPKVEIEYHTVLLNAMPNEVLSNRVDVAVSVLPLEHPNVVSRPFTSGRMICILPTGHPLLGKRTISVADLSSEPLVLHHPKIAFGRLVESMFREQNLPIIRRATVLQTEAACALVEAGVGIAIVDPYTPWGNTWRIEKRPLEQEIPLRPCIGYSIFENPNRNAQRFMNIIKSLSNEMSWAASVP